MNPWHALTHWLTSDMYTLEERELMREQARRLKLRTDLQEQRIVARAKRRETYRLIGTWTCPCSTEIPGTKERCNAKSVFYLEEHTDHKMRRVRAGPQSREDNGIVIRQGDLAAFYTIQDVYVAWIAQWLQGTLTHDDLRDSHEEIKITIPRRRK